MDDTKLARSLFKDRVVHVVPINEPNVTRRQFGITPDHCFTMQGVIAELINHSVSKVESTVVQFGELYAYRFIPWGHSDPPFLYCDTNHDALRPYWKACGPAIDGRLLSAWRFNKAVEYFRKSAQFPYEQEAHIDFALNAMLAFKNEVILRHK